MKSTISLIFLLLFICTNSFSQGMETNTNIVLVDNPSDPNELYDFRSQHPLAKGFIDVTKPPYNADPTGATDCLAGIQKAVNDGRDYNYVVFFPSGTYKVSNQIQCFRTSTRSDRKFGMQLIGSTKGTRPVLKLVPSGAVTNNIFVFFDFIYNDGSPTSDSSQHYGSHFRGIDIDMGNNPTVNAISMSGAQYSNIEDVNIYGTNFNSGISSLPGSGGFTANVSVDGGTYGIIQNQYRPNPTITGLTLINQKTAGIWLNLTRGPLVVTGFKIVSPNPAPSGYRGIQITGGTSVANSQGALCLTDGSIQINSSTSFTAIENGSLHSITINNLYAKAGRIVNSGTSYQLTGDASNWKRLNNYIFTGTADAGTVYKDFVSQKTLLTDAFQSNTVLVNAEPPTDLLSKHVWNATTMPSWEDTNLVNIVTDYGATPENVNGTDDDQDNIQNAINFAIANNKTVFIPRGHFHIGSSLNFPSGLKIIGSSKTFSIIQQKSDVLTTAPLIQSEDNASGGLVMSDFGILTFPYRTMLNIRTNNTIFRDILTEIVWTAKNCYNATYCGAYKNGPTRPYMLFSGNAGGKIFGIVADQLMVPTGNPPTHNVADFNLVKVSTQQPLEFHQFSIEHIDNSPQVQINSAKDVTIYGFKFEGTFELLNIFNSKNINLIGGSGNYGLEDTSSRGIIYVDNTSINILMQNLCRKSWGTIDYANTTGFWVKGDGAAPLNSVVGSNSVTSFVISNILFPSWNGLTDIDWTKTTNWDLETVPNSTSNVTIPTGTPNQPTIATDVAINSLAIATGASLTAIGTNLTVTGAIANSGTMTLANNSNLIQGGTTNANTGNITVKRNSTLLSRLDYTIWSSPVTNSSQFLTTFSPLTSTNRFYNYNEATNVYNVIPSPSTTSFSLASGYFIRMPNTAVTAPATETFIGVFTGVPNNGDITKAVTYNGTAPFGYNMVGNPYPSTISADAFIAANATKIESSLYFWRKINGASGSAYAVYNSMGATKTPSSAIPNGIIQVGQGFLVKAKSTSSLIFNNTMRVANNSNQFFKTKQLVEKDRVWLNLTNNSGVFSQALIGYTTDATLGVDIYDAKYINDSPTAFTSNINNEEYTIQGRPSFDVSDVVPLNFKTDVAGDYTIAIDLAEGLLAATQEVYLVDNKMEAETNLKTGPYTFSAIAGVDNNRFSLKYQKTLKVDGRAFDENSVNVFRNNGSLFVNSQSVSLNEIQVFDIQGRFLAALKNVNATTAVIKDLKAAHQVLIVKISDQNNNVISKKVLN